ncbi:hypothetical protein EB796_014558 [Bugula neritina]|uniref:Sushi domain-containing protein n=1 Tax=Bugula neritina TaxID=10212 RepID=A0A7J7JNY4_BUGNE|nr:hypothetical protein EB796_014558 [Bugula neritina]
MVDEGDGDPSLSDTDEKRKGKASAQLECFRPEVPAYATISPDTGIYLPGSAVSYKCAIGHTLTDGNITRYCLNSSWTGIPPLCILSDYTCSGILIFSKTKQCVLVKPTLVPYNRAPSSCGLHSKLVSLSSATEDVTINDVKTLMIKSFIDEVWIADYPNVGTTLTNIRCKSFTQKGAIQRSCNRRLPTLCISDLNIPNKQSICGSPPQAPHTQRVDIYTKKLPGNVIQQQCADNSILIRSRVCTCMSSGRWIHLVELVLFVKRLLQLQQQLQQQLQLQLQQQLQQQLQLQLHLQLQQQFQQQLQQKLQQQLQQKLQQQLQQQLQQ